MNVLISTKPFHLWKTVWVGSTVRTVMSLSAVIPLGTSTERANFLKEQITDGSQLFKDAVPSVSSWLWSLPVFWCRTRSLSSVSGHPTWWSCFRGWLMRLLWAYEHDFTAISPLFCKKSGTLCRYPYRSLWLEQGTAGWRSGRSENYSKSLSAGWVPTDPYSSRSKCPVRLSSDFAGPPPEATSI